MLRAEFPDYDTATLPPIPDDWEESSWHNDACPSFTASADRLHVFVDYADPAAREFRDGPRFNVRGNMFGIDGGDDDFTDELLNTDDWAEVLRFVADWKPPER